VWRPEDGADINIRKKDDPTSMVAVDAAKVKPRCTTNPEHRDREAVTTKCFWRNDPCRCCEDCKKICVEQMSETD
jgi:hypothetical protein